MRWPVYKGRSVVAAWPLPGGGGREFDVRLCEAAAKAPAPLFGEGLSLKSSETVGSNVNAPARRLELPRA